MFRATHRTSRFTASRVSPGWASRAPGRVLALSALVLGGGCDPPEATTIAISPPAPVLKDVGDAVRLTAVVRDQNGDAMAGVPVAWTSSDSFVVRLSESGLVTAEEPGTVLVTAAAAAVTAEAAVVVEPGQHAVLHKIYRVMGGDGWSNNTNWKTEEPLRAWHGVHTDVHGSIVTLSLRDNGLTGVIPPEVGSLHLRNLLLSDNRVSGPIPAELGNLQDLEALDLGVNELTGSIPAELGNLPSLEFLNLFDNPLTGSIPPELGNLRNLRILSLESLRLTGSIPPELGNLRNLTAIHLRFNRLTGPIPPELGNLQSLEALYVEDNELAGPVPGEIGDLALRILHINDNPLTGPLPREMIGMPLIHFHWNDTELCAPADDAFQEWLGSIYHTIGGEDCDSLADLGQSGARTVTGRPGRVPR